jgi:O-antigen/teichoic acid export membrane protein
VRFLKNLRLLTFGTIISKILGTLLYPILTRSYSTDSFANYSLISSIVTISYPIFTYYYQLAIPLEKNIKEIERLLLFFIINSIIISTILFFTFNYLPINLFTDIQILKSENYFLIIVLLTFLMAYTEILYSIGAKIGEFKPIIYSKIFQSLSFFIFSYLLINSFNNSNGLIWGMLVQYLCSVIIMSLYYRNFFQLSIFYSNLKEVIRTLQRNKDYPIFRLPFEIISKIIMYFPVFFFFYFFNKDTTGQIGLAITMMGVPVSLIGTSIGRAYYSELSNKDNSQDQIKHYTKYIFNTMFKYGIIPSLILILTSIYLSDTIFGSEWKLVGKYFSVLIPLSLVKLAIVPTIGIFNYFNKQKTLFLIGFINLLSLAFLMISHLIFPLSDMGFLFFYSIIVSFFHLYTYYYIIKKLF